MESALLPIAPPQTRIHSVTFTLALFSAACSCRGAVLQSHHRRGVSLEDQRAQLAACIACALDRPGLLSGSSATPEERRPVRVQPPEALPHNPDLSRTDGEIGFSRWRITGVWGEAWWRVGMNPWVLTYATAASICPDPSSDNIAEFFGLREALGRAFQVLPTRVVFELNSLLIVMMMTGKWSCHSAHLMSFIAKCYDLGEQLTQAGWTGPSAMDQSQRSWKKLARGFLEFVR